MQVILSVSLFDEVTFEEHQVAQPPLSKAAAERLLYNVTQAQEGRQHP